MSAVQRGFSAGSIVTGIVMTVLLGVFSWVGNQTFENSQERVRIVEIMKEQARSSERLSRSIDKLDSTIARLYETAHNNEKRIIRLEERLR